MGVGLDYCSRMEEIYEGESTNVGPECQLFRRYSISIGGTAPIMFALGRNHRACMKVAGLTLQDRGPANHPSWTPV